MHELSYRIFKNKFIFTIFTLGTNTSFGNSIKWNLKPKQNCLIILTLTKKQNISQNQKYLCYSPYNTFWVLKTCKKKVVLGSFF